jgi:hypothetical protein
MPVSRRNFMKTTGPALPALALGCEYRKKHR